MGRKKSIVPKTNGAVDKTDSDALIGVPSNRMKKYVSTKVLKNVQLTPKQQELMEVIDNNQITIITGPAGSSKTFLMCYYVIDTLKKNKFEHILLTKPIQEAGEKLGALPGDVEEKINPHYESFKLNFLKMVDKQTLERNYKNSIIENKPIAYLRGTGWDNCLDGKTKIITNQGEMTLEDVFEAMVERDEVINVLSYNFNTHEQEFNEINGIERSIPDKDVLKITLENGEEIIATNDHVFYDINGNIKRLDEFEIGDEFFIKKD